jgi:hypothetical protein
MLVETQPAHPVPVAVVQEVWVLIKPPLDYPLEVRVVQVSHILFQVPL